MNSYTVIPIIVLGAIVAYIILIYNTLVRLRMRTREALSDIDAQAKRRYDLIPNLVETVKGYAKHEKETIENVTKARNAAMQSGGSAIDKAKAENQLSMTLKTLFAVSENYPDLKANANFLDLQRELADTENKMLASRRFYNTTAQELNVKIEQFPSNIIGRMFSFEKVNFFEMENAAEREPVKVKF